MNIKENKERLKKLIGYAISKGVATSQKDFGRVLGYENESSFSQLLNKEQISDELIKKIKETLPEINIQWLINGVGDMIEKNIIPSNSQVGVGINSNSTIDKALDEIAAQRKMTEALQNKLFDLIDKLTEKM